jgi:hypothetical protein
LHIGVADVVRFLDTEIGQISTGSKEVFSDSSKWCLTNLATAAVGWLADLDESKKLVSQIA